MTSDTGNAGILKILETHLKAMDSEFTTLTQKAQQVVGLATIVIGFAAALNSFNLNNPNLVNQPPIRDIQKWLIIADLVIYGLICLLYSLATFPGTWHSYPIDITGKKMPTEKKIDELRAIKDDEEFYRYLFDRFPTCLDENDKRLKGMASLVRWATLLLFIEVVIVGISKVV